MRYPEFLKDGGTIGFAAPSFGCNIEPYRSAFDNALKRFREMGYGTVLGPNCYEGSGLGISNKPEICGKELNDMSKRFEAAIKLNEGANYLDIAADVGLSTATISRVSRSLNYGEGGYQAALERLNNKK